MRYKHWKTLIDKLDAWLELCDLSFELMKSGLRISHKTDKSTDIGVSKRMKEIRHQHLLSNIAMLSSLGKTKRI